MLAPIPHRQYVSTMPKVLRPHFRRNRKLLGELCRLVAKLLRRFYRTAIPHGEPALVLYVQTWGRGSGRTSQAVIVSLRCG